MSRVLSVGLVALTLIAAEHSRAAAEQSDLEAQVKAAFRAAYDLDQDLALSRARAAVSSFPNESRAHRALAAVLWVDIIFRRGAVTVDHYMGGVARSQLSLAKPPPALDAEFKLELGRAIDLANQRLREVPKDVQARYDFGAAYGLQASYQASVEGSITSAFLSARRAFDAEEDVLARDPQRVSAGVVVGTYRYVVAGLALPSRMFAYMLGFGGDKERGISLLQSAALDPLTHVEAKLALVLIFSREGRQLDALRLLGELTSEYPRNRIFVLEQGSAALRAGRPGEAETLLTRGLDMFERDPRRKIPGERALWLYKRGVARLALNHLAESAGDLNAALDSAPEAWVQGRIRLALGKVSDVSGQRAQAVASYETARNVCSAANDPVCVTDASRWLKQRYVLPAHPQRP